jgi:hypothetical protein
MTPQARVYYEFSRLVAMEDWWHFALLAAVALAIIAYVYWMYRRDWVELPRPIGWSLLLLRIAAFVGLLLFFFDLQKRSELPIVKSSRLAVLVDDSLSMTLPVGDAVSEISVPETAVDGLSKATVALDPNHPTESRIQQVQRTFASSNFIDKLSEQHEVTIYQFGDQRRLAPLLTIEKKNSTSVNVASADASWTWRLLSTLIWIGTVLVIIGFIAIGLAIYSRLRAPVRRNVGESKSGWLFSEHHPTAMAYVALSGVVAMIIGLVCTGTAALRGSEHSFWSLWSFTEPAKQTNFADDNVASTQVASTSQFDWQANLTAQGSSTALGDGIAAILAREQNAPLAGIVVLTDGQTNSGLSIDSAAGQATAAEVPIYAIGLGSSLDPINVRIVDLNAPRRVFPSDPFRISATVQATGMNGKSIAAQLRRRSGTSQDANGASFTIEQETTIELPEDGQMAALAFDVTPPAIGAHTYDVKLLAPSQDSNKNDDAADADVEVIEPKATVLIFAGGPTREYQFVRNLLFRDDTIQSHIYLQTGSPGMSQEADEILTAFPTTSQEMSKYDCVLTFDADFMQLEKTSVDVLEDWVSSGAGGLVFVAGPVATPEWAGSGGNTDARAAILRNMSPVILNAKGARLISLGRFDGETLWPLQVTQDASTIDFLDISNSAAASNDAWKQFPGVYSFYSTYEPKPGATSLALYSDPTTAVDGKLPIYLASQFYGGGRVVFQGSGEMWRIRELDDNYFNTYWTKLVRWSAQGRLLRDSDYGLLLVDKEEALLGEQITVRAVLKDAQFRPLTQSSVSLNLIDPDNRLTALTLNQLPGTGQAGVYVGQFLLRRAGRYQLSLDTRIVPDAVLTKQVTARVPTLEIERPKRNDQALASLSERTGGKYYAGVANAIAGKAFPINTNVDQTKSTSTSDGASEAESQVDSFELSSADAPIFDSILSRDQVTFLPGSPDRSFQERWMLILLISIASVLSLEWLIRRLCRLA